MEIVELSEDGAKSEIDEDKLDGVMQKREGEKLIAMLVELSKAPWRCRGRKTLARFDAPRDALRFFTAIIMLMFLSFSPLRSALSRLGEIRWEEGLVL